MVDTLAIKCERALDAAGCDTLVVAGGVAPTSACARSCSEIAGKRGGRVCFPRPALCTDNGAMIAFAGACACRPAARAKSRCSRAGIWHRCPPCRRPPPHDRG